VAWAGWGLGKAGWLGWAELVWLGWAGFLAGLLPGWLTTEIPAYADI